MTVVGYNKRTTRVHTPAGTKAKATAGGAPVSSVIKKVTLWLSVPVNGAGSPVAANFEGDACACVRVSQGLFRFTLGGSTDLLGKFGVKKFLGIHPTLRKSAAGSALRAVPAGTVAASGTFDVRIEDAAGAAQDPVAAGADERIDVLVCFDNGAI